MLLLFVLASMFGSCNLLVSGAPASVFRQRYNSGSPTLGGCTGGLYPNDNNTYPLGSCFAASSTSSLWVNDCWNNGLGSATVYAGSTTCNASFAASMFIFDTTRPGQQVPYCNVGGNPTAYNTFTCTDYSTPQITTTTATNTTANATATPLTQYITITNYPTPTATNCSGTNVTLNITVGQCSRIGDNQYVIANCASGMVTAAVYSTSNCSILFDGNGAISMGLNGLFAFGPYSQMGAPSAVGKAIGTPGSDCASTSSAYMQFQCFPTTVTLPTTPIPQQPSTSSSSGTTASPSSISSGTGTGTSGNTQTGSATNPSTGTGTGTLGTANTTTGTGTATATGTATGTLGASTGSTGKNNPASHVAASCWIWGMLALGITTVDKYLL